MTPSSIIPLIAATPRSTVTKSRSQLMSLATASSCAWSQLCSS
jgi:hypothetical protein